MPGRIEVSRLETSSRQALPARLSLGDTVALLAPASWAEDDWIEATAQRLTDWGWRVRLGDHVRDRLGYLAGNDSDRLSDLNGAIGDPQIRAIVCVTGGCGSFRRDARGAAHQRRPLRRRTHHDR